MSDTTNSSKKMNKSKSKTNTNFNTKSSNKTISGLPPSGLITNIYAACLGLVIFVGAPYVVNQYNNTLLANVVNIFPTGVALSLFIKEEDFKSYYFKLLFVPFIFVVLNWILYYFYDVMNMKPISVIMFNLGLWIAMVIFAIIYG